MTIGQIDLMPMEEYLGWQEFYNIEPWGLPIQDAMQANIISVMANLERNPKERPDPYLIKDFLLYPAPSKPIVEATVEGKTAAQWKIIFAAEALQAAQKRKIPT